MNTINIRLQSGWDDYELLDSGNGRKLERYGKHVLNRPENQALWKPNLPDPLWQKAYAVYEKTGERGEWNKKEKEYEWQMTYQNLTFWVRLTPFGHTGVFPEQAEQWKWIQEAIQTSRKETKVLSLFTYTGLSTLAAARAGAHVVHVDASGPSVTWARENAKLSGLTDKPIRWIVDDALKFVKREARRANTYDAIIMDPPKFGRGTRGEVWQFEKNFPELLSACQDILVANPVFILITAYALPISSLTLANMISGMMKRYNGRIESGELTIQETNQEKRLLSEAIYAKWESA